MRSAQHCSQILLPALAMSVGWGFRGNYGHEAGAMVPGALVALAVLSYFAQARMVAAVHPDGIPGGDWLVVWRADELWPRDRLYRGNGTSGCHL